MHIEKAAEFNLYQHKVALNLIHIDTLNCRGNKHCTDAAERWRGVGQPAEDEVKLLVAAGAGLFLTQSCLAQWASQELFITFSPGCSRPPPLAHTSANLTCFFCNFPASGCLSGCSKASGCAHTHLGLSLVLCLRQTHPKLCTISHCLHGAMRCEPRALMM